MKKIVAALTAVFLAAFVSCTIVHESTTPAQRLISKARQLHDDQALHVVDSVCMATLYQNVCLLSLHARQPQYEQSVTSGGPIKDMAIISVASRLSSQCSINDEISRAAIEDCEMLFQSALRHLNGSLELLSKPGEWRKPFQALNAHVSKLVSNSLAIVNIVPVQVPTVHRCLLSEALSVTDGFLQSCRQRTRW